RFTMYPDSVQGGNGGFYTKERVVRNAHVTTSLAAGSAFEFALDIVEQLLGPEKKAAVAGPMFLPQ
ncbi:MAG TPA: DJ-1 family protein, partial [Leptospiraceae bacterium]|nr:DJ-1 family protein [Leptospiraceae bacterium]